LPFRAFGDRSWVGVGRPCSGARDRQADARIGTLFSARARCRVYPALAVRTTGPIEMVIDPPPVLAGDVSQGVVDQFSHGGALAHLHGRVLARGQGVNSWFGHDHSYPLSGADPVSVPAVSSP